MSNQSLAPGRLPDPCAAPAISWDCRDTFGHHRCDRHGAAWDFVLDRSTDCLCACHAIPPVMSGTCLNASHQSCPQQGQAWDQPSGLPACTCRCHLAAHLISLECQNPRTHRVCLEYGMASDLLTGAPADCHCGCHSTGPG